MDSVVFNNLIILISEVVVLHKKFVRVVGIFYLRIILLEGNGVGHNGSCTIFESVNAKTLLLFIHLLFDAIDRVFVGCNLNSFYKELLSVEGELNLYYVECEAVVVAETVLINTVLNALGEVIVCVDSSEIFIQIFDQIFCTVNSVVKTAHKVGANFGTPEVCFYSNDGIDTVTGFFKTENAVFGGHKVDELKDVNVFLSDEEIIVSKLIVRNLLAVKFNERTACYVVLHSFTEFDCVFNAINFDVGNLSTADRTYAKYVGSVGGFVSNYT